MRESEIVAILEIARDDAEAVDLLANSVACFSGAYDANTHWPPRA